MSQSEVVMEIDTRYAPYCYGQPKILSEPVHSRSASLPGMELTGQLFKTSFEDHGLELMGLRWMFRSHFEFSTKPPPSCQQRPCRICFHSFDMKGLIIHLRTDCNANNLHFTLEVIDAKAATAKNTLPVGGNETCRDLLQSLQRP